MKSNYFNRTAEVIVGKSGETGVSISGLRISFDISKTDTPESNTCKVMIYNLAKNTRNKIRADADLLLELRVGYTEGYPIETIFVGDIMNVTHDNSVPDVITTIEVADGAKAIKFSTTSLSVAKDTTLRQVFEKAVKTFNLPEKTRLSLVEIPDIKFLTGFAFEGHTSELMNQLCFDYGLQWSIQNNELKIYLKDSTDASAAVKTILIGSPIHVVKKETKTCPADSESFTGWEFKTLLLPQAEPGGNITLSSRDITTPITLKVIEVKHTGDTFGDEWTSSIKGKTK